MINSTNPYYLIDDVARLAKAFVEAELKLIANSSSDIGGDAQKLKDWLDSYFKYSPHKAPKIDWSPYIIESN